MSPLLSWFGDCCFYLISFKEIKKKKTRWTQIHSLRFFKKYFNINHPLYRFQSSSFLIVRLSYHLPSFIYYNIPHFRPSFLHGYCQIHYISVHYRTNNTIV